MASTSEPLRLWTQKLNELVKLAGELQHEDQKSAAESCQLAGQHIQSLWAKASQALVKNEVGSVKVEGQINTRDTSSPVVLS